MSEAAWSPEMCELIGWFRLHRDELPREPYQLRPYASVLDPDAWHASLEADIREGPEGPRARNTALQTDLAAVRRCYESRVH